MDYFVIIKTFNGLFCNFLAKTFILWYLCTLFTKSMQNNTQKSATKGMCGVDEGGGVPLYIVRALTLVCVRLSIYILRATPSYHATHNMSGITPPRHTPAPTRHQPPRHIAPTPTPQPTHEAVSGAGPVLLRLLRLLPFRYANRCKIIKPLSALCLSF